ncbi:MAG: protein kinase [Gammaproteobacteria bacterium]
MHQEIRFRKRQRHGKYRIESCLLRGPYANVYSACDTIEGVKVALKLPHKDTQNKDYLSDFKRETRIAAKLSHPNVLPLKDASFINDVFTMVTPLGTETLGDRLKRRLSNEKALDYARQLICAVAYAHEQGIMHCDIKPPNMILFSDGRLRLADFGIAKTTFKTVQASGSGTLGYLAPEQAMGRPSFRSDVFAVGLILHQMLSGVMYEWPFRWPSPGHKRLKQRAHPNLVKFIQRALEFQPNKRFRDGTAMRNAWQALDRRGQLHGKARAGSARMSASRTYTGSKNTRHWRDIQFKQFQRSFGKTLETNLNCKSCQGPVSDSMSFCPWCKTKTAGQPYETRYDLVCPHCSRGVKKDWEYCPWCYGSGFEASSAPRADKRYTAKCQRSSCGKPLMPFMKYCPWCHARTQQKWKLKGAESCGKCEWGIAGDYWSYCPWCSTSNKDRK